MDYTEQFRAFAEQKGVILPAKINTDKEIHRFSTNGKATDTAGWYIYFDNDGTIPGANFGDWRAGIDENWSPNVEGMTPEDKTAQQAMLAELKTKVAAEQERTHNEAAEKAKQIWQNAKPAPADHPYLIRKRIQPYKLRIVENRLVIPIGRSGIGLRSLQFIGPDGRKTFLTNGQVRGCYYALGKLEDIGIYVAEGYATAATIYGSTNKGVVVAFNAGNMPAVARTIRDQYPNASITICADDDWKTAGNPGLTKAKEAAAAIGAKLAVPDFGEHRLPSWSDFNDLANALGADRARECLGKALEQPPEPAEPPRPLMRAIPLAEPFPVDALGEFLGGTALAIHDRAQNPVAICAQSVLAAACLAVMGHADVALPIGRVVPISLYLIAMALTGERKSSGDDAAMVPIEQYERELRAEYDAAKFAYQIQHRGWEVCKEQIEKQAKGKVAISREELQLKLQEHGPPPEPPLEPTMLTDEPTIQGLELHYKTGLPILGLFATEGGKFICGHSMADGKTKIRASTSLSDFWDGKPIRRMRAENGSLYMSGRRLAMHLQIQPEVANGLLADTELRAQGFLSRLLIAYPQSMIGERMQRPEQESTAPRLAAYYAWMLDILRQPLPVSDDRKNELRPVVLSMSEEAKALWLGFADAVERQMARGGSLRHTIPLVNKMPAQAARLAAVLILWDSKLVAKEISAEYMVRGITLAKYYITEAVRLSEIAAVNVQLLQAERLLDWLQIDWEEPAVSLPDIYQLGPGSIRDAATARSLVRHLEDHGWLQPIPEGATIRGKRRRVAWLIVKELFDAGL
jgi:putative DNA primase/helicase